METDGGKGAALLEKGLSLFGDILRSPGTPLSQLAARAQIPASTAQRIVAAFMRHGLLSRIGHGRYAAGLRMAARTGQGDAAAVLDAAARPLVRALARNLATTVHLGVLEGDMVTYLVKEHGAGPALRTREANQLEAYCSGIGKVLLAALDESARTRYLAAGPFVRLTPNTITDAAILRDCLLGVRACGFATDRAEFEEGLYCLAVPVRGPGSGIVAAISASSTADHCDDAAWLRHLRAGADRIGRRLGAIGPVVIAARVAGQV